jgi:hypothetical protein
VTGPSLDPAAVALLERLPAWDADTYAEHKERLATGLTRPGGALIAEVARRLDADLLRHKALQVRYREPLPASLDDGFVDWCVDRLEVLLPVHRWLLAHLVDEGGR